MVSDRLRSVRASSELLLLMTLIATTAACVLLAYDHTGWGIIAYATACLCLVNVFTNIERLRYRIRYLLNAAINGDFSYKFRDDSITSRERELNTMLNNLVAHLEALGQSIRQNEEFLQLIINLIDSGIVIANDRGHIVQANRAALAMLNLPVLTDMKQIPNETSGLSISKTQTTLRGEHLTIYTIADIRRPIQTAEVQSWEKLTRVLTHEIMNSLTPISSIAGSLSRQANTDPDELRQQLSVISSSSHSLMDFVGNFRKFTILPAPKPKVLYVKAAIDKALTLMRAQPNAQGIDFSVEIFPPDAMIYTDESMLGQVIVNIVKNAVEASPRKISIKSKIRDDESVEISISNDGAPITPEAASQIFTPFFTTKPTGSGIGLSLSRRIINHLGGSLTLTLQPHPTFTISL